MKVYLTYKNSDTTEGRGPMVLDSIFLHRKDAAEYIDQQPGIMGCMGKWSEEKYGDWQINEMDVYESFVDMKTITLAKEKAVALSKLTPKERQILGLQ